MVSNDSKVTRNFYELAFFFGHRSDSNSERLAIFLGEACAQKRMQVRKNVFRDKCYFSKP